MVTCKTPWGLPLWHIPCQRDASSGAQKRKYLILKGAAGTRFQSWTARVMMWMTSTLWGRPAQERCQSYPGCPHYPDL